MTKLGKLLPLALPLAYSNMIPKREANLHLRVRRGGGFMEEVKAGNLERECLEEKCIKHEFDEIYSAFNKYGLVLKFRHFSGFLSEIFGKK